MLIIALTLDTYTVFAKIFKGNQMDPPFRPAPSGTGTRGCPFRMRQSQHTGLVEEPTTFSISGPRQPHFNARI